MEPRVLKLSASGIPIGWTTLKDAAIKMCSQTSDGGVLWSLDDKSFTLRGGFNSMTGKRSDLKIPAIIAVKESGKIGQSNIYNGFKRDLCKLRDSKSCAYCGKYVGMSITMDHIFPESKGGLWTMENIISACKKCNNDKQDKTIEEAGMRLLFAPFRPTMAEELFIMREGKMLGVQYEYLREQFKHSDMRDYFGSYTEIETLSA